MLGNNNLWSTFTDASSVVPARLRHPAKPVSMDTGFAGLVTGYLVSNEEKTDIKGIKWALKRFPELHYHISALATFTSFTNQYPWVGKDVFGPGGISVTAKPKLNPDDARINIVNQAFKAVQEGGLDGTAIEQLGNIVSEAVDPKTIGNTIQSDVLIIKELAHKLLSYNNIYLQLYKAARSLIIYSACIVDFSEDYSIITFYSIDEVEKIKQESTPDSAVDTQWRIIKDKNKILSDRAQVITDDDPSNSPVGRIIHYLRIIDLLETSLSVERLAKSNSFIVWKVGVDGMPGELVTPWLDVYKERVMTRLKAGTDNGNIVQATMSKSLTASHIFVPNYSDSPTEVEKLNMEYRPFLEDLEYWWSKTFMALGIPPYYSVVSSQTNNINSDITAFHEGLLGSRVRMYQAILEKVLVLWVRNFIQKTLSEEWTSKYQIMVLLPTYVSGGEESRSEYMRRVNQFASAYSTLSISGLPISPDFAVRLMFPNADPHEVVDWSTRKIMNPESTSIYDEPKSPTDSEEDAYIDNVLNTMESGVLADQSINSSNSEPQPIPEELSVTNMTGNKEI